MSSSEDSFNRWLSTLRSKQTAKTYRVGTSYLVGDGNEFLQLAKDDRKAAEEFLISRIIKLRDEVSGATCRNYMVAVKSFFDYEEVEFSWKKISKVLPKYRNVAFDRCPTVDEVRKLISVCRQRDQAITFILLSGGPRVGAFEWLSFGDYSRLDSGIGKLIIYKGFPEEHYTFISPEACDALEYSFVERRKEGEIIKYNSPLFRHCCNILSDLSPNRLTRLHVRSICAMYNVNWVKSGVRQFAKKENIRYRAEFKAVHGFRKFFKTRASQIMKRNDVEYLMGHLSGLDANYYKPEQELLEKEYLKAVPLLTISEVAEVNQNHKGQMDKEREKFQGVERLVLKLQTQIDDIKDEMKKQR